VPATKDLVLADAEKAKGDDKASLEQIANSPLIYPSEADQAKLRSYKALTSAEEKVFESIFQPITQG
jgi:spermidine/putrescine transport system substrate-binding protein